MFFQENIRTFFRVDFLFFELGLKSVPGSSLFNYGFSYKGTTDE